VVAAVADTTRPEADLAAWRRVVVDHIVTGLAHPDEAVQRQALVLQTELDVADLNVDADVKAARTRS
jgi:hypothetical protein